MKFEIPFNSAVHEKQMQLLFKEAWKKNLSKNKRNIFSAIAILICSGTMLYLSSPFGYIFAGVSLFYILNITHVYLAYKRNKKEFFDLSSRFSLQLANSNVATIWEFFEDHFYYKDVLVEGKLKWETVKGCRVIDQNLLVDVSYGIPASYIIGIEDVGEENFNKLSTFVQRMIKTHTL